MRSELSKTPVNPLVSIIVVTYNSSQYVLETLESAKAQTYQNIELIVTDDSSTDNTVEICREWLDKNRSRFVRTELITSPVNTGTSANCNRGLRSAKGEWLKFIAGDDLLTDNCIEDFVNYIIKNPNSKIVFGKTIELNGKNLTPQKLPVIFFKSLKRQEFYLYAEAGLSAAAYFINNGFLNELGGFDENYPLIEDMALWIKLAKKKEPLLYIDKFVVLYRIHSQNISTFKGNNYINSKYYFDKKLLIKNEIIPYLIKNKNYFYAFLFRNELFVTDMIIKLGNKNMLISSFLNMLILRRYVIKIKYLLGLK
jgi:alpha-1,3-rhamnosyltransferase